MHGQALKRFSLFLSLGAIGAFVVAGAATGCAGTTTDADDFETSSSGGGNTTAANAGGSGGSGASGGAGTGGDPGPCGTDCSTIQTPDCQVAQCNVQTGMCEVVNDEDGVACDDGLFCTISDSCSAGACVGGPQNDCGMAPPQCTEVTCDETSQTCSTMPSMNGAPCQDPNDLCLKGSTCTNGLCVGGQQDDCFFVPVPECHVAVCDPMDGMCKPQVGNEGGMCNDPNDPCTVNKTCAMGVCQGGNPKDCSHLTVDCNLGVCDTMNGQCTTQAVMNGQPCDDLDMCTTGEICTNMTCGGGTAITACVNNDGCCPMNCTQNNDSDCSCNVNHALTATGSSSGGGSGSYGPSVWNDQTTGSQCCGCQGWVSNGTSPGGAWIQYDWNTQVTIGSFWIDTNLCAESCGNGRNVKSGEVQTWNGNQWVTRTTFNNQDGDFGVTISPAVSTTKLRIYNITTNSCGQGSNTMIHEWWVFPGSNCQGTP